LINSYFFEDKLPAEPRYIFRESRLHEYHRSFSICFVNLLNDTNRLNNS